MGRDNIPDPGPGTAEVALNPYRNMRVAAMALACFAFAQAERKPMAGGLLGGMNVATFWGDDAEAFNDVRFWPVAGFSLSFHLPRFLGFEADLIYASRGGAFSRPAGDSLGGNILSTIKAQTLTIPLLIKITAPIGTEVQPIFFGGPAWAYMLSKGFATERVYTDSNGSVQSQSLPPLVPKDQMRPFDVLLVLGGGLEWGLGTIQVRLNLAQQSLDRRKGQESQDVRTLTLDVMAGFQF